MPDLLIISNSYDVTTDLLLKQLQGEAVFRFNLDQFSRYQILVDAGGSQLSDAAGRCITSQSVCKAYWRKPFNAHLEDDSACSQYITAELRYALSELTNLLWLDSKLVLVEPFAEKRAGKLVQLRVAQAFFDVPGYEFVVNRKPARSSGVVKSLSGELVKDRVLFTTRVETGRLAAPYPWFIHQEITASEDVTVVFVRGRIFAFALYRDFLDRTVDWRQVDAPEQRWLAHKLPDPLVEAILKYMSQMRLDYGRLDFLLDVNGCYWFCEVNPNGQFAWLDLDDKQGLLQCIATEIAPSTPVHPLHNLHPLDVLSL